MAGDVDRDPRDIDQLIEEGLTRYGTGDLDGALLVWEQALALDPENPQANSYVDYVRMNYEMLTNDLARDEDAPFAIGDDEPEYQIEILPGGDAGEPVAPRHADPIDEGWFIEAEPGPANSEPRTITADFPQITLELDDADTVARVAREATEQELSFESSTREYPDGKGNPSSDLLDDADDDPSGFRANDETPPFGQLSDYETPTGGWITHVRKRDLGFVQPTTPEPAQDQRAKRASGPPELKMTLRTPAPEPPPDNDAEIELSYDSAPDADELHPALAVTVPQASRESLDLALPAAGARPGRPSQGVPTAVPHTNTRELPGATRPPASPSEPPPPRTRTTDFEQPQPTGDFSAQRTEKLPVPAGEVPVRDLPTGKLPALARPPAKRSSEEVPPLPLISAPTRDLGIRPRPSSEDETTLNRERSLDATVSDASPPELDPIDTRTESILAEIDAGVTGPESKEDRTRRRITSLFERAHDWQQAGDHERAVAAVDLALAEDPNSALAQKLIHRHRDIVLTVLAAFLGELDRIPTLARPLHELADAPISPRAAFLLSRIDGVLSLEEILDVSGMPRIEAMRYLCQLFLRGILR